MKTKLCLLFVMAVLATSQLAYGQANGCSTPHAAAVEPAGTAFIILVPVQGPPVQYQPVHRVVHQCAPHYPVYRHYGYRHYGGYGYHGYGYRNYGYNTGTTVIVRNPRTGRAYMVSRKWHRW